MALEIRIPQLAYTGSSTAKGWVQVSVTPTANSLLGFNASSVPANVTIGAGLALAGNVLSATNSGSVTSVGLSMPTGFSVANSPVTSTGTLAVTTTLNGIVYGDGANALAAVTIGSGLTFVGGTLSATGAGGTVTSVSVVTANGVSGSVATATTTPAITLTLGAITPTSVNGLTISTTTGTLTITNGKTFSVSNTLTLAGTDGSALDVGTGGTLGSAAFTAASAYEVPLTFSTGLTRAANTITVNTSQNIATLSNLTTNGLVTTSGGVGTLGVTVPGAGILTALGVDVGSAGAPVLFNGAGGTPSSIVLTNGTGLPTILVADTTSTTCQVALFESATGELAPKTDGALTYNASSGVLTAVGFVGGLVGNVIGIASTATILQNARTIGGVSFNGSANIVPTTIVVADTTDSTCFVGLWESATGDLLPKTDAGLTYDASTGTLSVGGDLSVTGDMTVTDLNVTNLTISGTITGVIDVPNGGTGRATSTTAYGLIAAGTTATGAHQTLAAGATTEILVGGGASALPVWTTATGSGAPVRATSPTLVTPALGTPSSGTLTNCTGLPASGIAAGVLGGNITLGESTGQILLDPALSADGTWSGISETGTAGATLAFGDLCYFAVADSRWELADADAESTAGPVMLGICVLAAASDGDPTVMLRYGKVRADAAFPTLTVGAPAYASTTTGDIQVAQPSGTDDVIRVVGHAVTADVLMFNPSGDWMTHT